MRDLSNRVGFFVFLLDCDGYLNPSIQSNNNLTIVDQVIALGALVESLWNSFWVE